jgi:hypothetical protein
MKVIAVTAIALFFSVIPASAQQDCNPLFTLFTLFGCYQSEIWFPAPLEPSQSHRKEHAHHHRNYYEHYRSDRRRDGRRDSHENAREPTVVHAHQPAVVVSESRPIHHPATIHHPAIVHHQNTSHEISQDRARDFVEKQVKQFCERYPKDKACHRIEQTEEKKE